jgi:ABC-type polysaccharide/polyol phosphate transport system ATPase subunit
MIIDFSKQSSQSLSDDREVLVRVENVSKKFCRSLKKSLWYGIQDIGSEMIGIEYKHELRPDEFWSVKDVSFELRRGECLGLIGRNGAGKTTLLRMLNGLIKPDRGCIEINGQVGGLIALGAGFNPVLTGRENIYVNGSILGLNKAEIDAKLEEIIAFAEIGEFIDAPVQSYSSGMQVRLGFAVASVLLKPDVLLLDEVLAVGDASFQTKCINSIKKIAAEGTAIIFVSHDMHQILRFCNVGLYLSKGQIIKQGSIEDVSTTYLQNSQNSENTILEAGNVPISNELSFGEMYAVDENGNRITEFQFGKKTIFRIPIIIYNTISIPPLIIEFVMNDDVGVLFRELSSEINLPVSSHNSSVELEITIPYLPLSSTYLVVGIHLWSSDYTIMYAWSRNNRFNFNSVPSPGRLNLMTSYRLLPVN